MSSQNAAAAPKALKPKCPYILGDLYKTHWPEWDVYSKKVEVVEHFDWIMNVRYRTGEYSLGYHGYPVSITEHANAPGATTTTRIYIPARYRPILRLLNAKMAWHMLCLTVSSPTPERGMSGDAEKEERHQVQTRRYQVWVDGARRNIIYCSSIREAFFEWIEREYYNGQHATGLVPKPPQMVSTKRCLFIENWMMHELLVQSHVKWDIHHWSGVSKNRKEWRATTDVFELDWDKLGSSLPWYGKPLRKKKDAKLLKQQKRANVKPHPLLEEYDHIRRLHGKEVKDFFNDMINKDFNSIAPTKLVPTVKVDVTENEEDDSDYVNDSGSSAPDSDSGMIVDDEEVEQVSDLFRFTDPQSRKERESEPDAEANTSDKDADGEPDNEEGDGPSGILEDIKNSLQNSWKLFEQYAASDAPDSTRIICDEIDNLFHGSAVFPAPLIVKRLQSVVDKVFPEPDVPADLATARKQFDMIFDVFETNENVAGGMEA